jgi:hypothetical protein
MTAISRSTVNFVFSENAARKSNQSTRYFLEVEPKFFKNFLPEYYK